MGVKSTESLITFCGSFSLKSLDAPQPAGIYLIVEEGKIDGLSFVAHRRMATMLQLPAIAISTLPREVILVDPEEFAAAVTADLESQFDHEKARGVH